jgi:hypothetical protein
MRDEAAESGKGLDVLKIGSRWGERPLGPRDFAIPLTINDCALIAAKIKFDLDESARMPIFCGAAWHHHKD